MENESLEEHTHSKVEKFFLNRKKLQNTINKLYKTNYNKIDVNSVKNLEFQSFHQASTKDAPFLPKPQKPKDKTLQHLEKNHVSLKKGVQICDLPKSPWGIHKSYNEPEFFNNHFKTGTENDQQVHSFNKKLRLYKKIVNKVKTKDQLHPIDYSPKLFIFNTRSGNMYCPKDTDSAAMYERVNEKFRRMREFTFESPQNSKLQNSFNTHNTRVKSSEVTNRLYTPILKPERSTYITDKYKELWIQDD